MMFQRTKTVGNWVKKPFVLWLETLSETGNNGLIRLTEQQPSRHCGIQVGAATVEIGVPHWTSDELFSQGQDSDMDRAVVQEEPG